MSLPERYPAMFARCAASGEGAFVPFTVLGDPDPAVSRGIIRALARSDADALELGIAFSDPVADGAAIQRAAARALSSGATCEQALRIAAEARREAPGKPIGLLVYANLVLHAGAGAFYRRAADAGVDSVLVADVPILESTRLEEAAARYGIAPVLIAPPNAAEDRLRAIASRSPAFVYVTSRPGVTGADRELSLEAAGILRRLRRIGSAPPLLGFGIATPVHVRSAIAMGAAGAIAGSAIAELVERNLTDPGAIPAAVGEFVREMKAATRR
jgi:tryptophan synthase alpha chain